LDPIFFDLWRSVEGILLWRIPVYCALALAQASSTTGILTGILVWLAFSGRLGTVEWTLWALAICLYLALLGSFGILMLLPFPSRAREKWIEISMERLLPTECGQFREAAEGILPTAPFAALLGWRLKVESHLWRWGRGYSEVVLARWARIGEGSIGERLTTTAVFFQKAAESVSEE